MEKKVISQAGKEVLKKTVVHIIPTYVTSYFLLPTVVIRFLDSMVLRFFWSGYEGNKKMCWKSQKDLCKPKNMGGMGFRDFEVFNFSFLAKPSPLSLVGNCLHAKYFQNGNFLAASLDRRPILWHSLLEGRNLLSRSSNLI